MSDRTNAQVALECATRLLTVDVDSRYSPPTAYEAIRQAETLLTWLDDHTSSVDQP